MGGFNSIDARHGQVQHHDIGPQRLKLVYSSESVFGFPTNRPVTRLQDARIMRRVSSESSTTSIRMSITTPVTFMTVRPHDSKYLLSVKFTASDHERRVHGLNGFHDFDVSLAPPHPHTNSFW